MKLRPVQLVCLALLLATLRLADPAALAPDDFALRAGVLTVLLRKDFTVDYATTTPFRRQTRRIPAPASAPERLCTVPTPAAFTTCWTMQPPATHSAAMQSFTSFARA